MKTLKRYSVTVDGEQFLNIKHASEATGISKELLYKRIQRSPSNEKRLQFIVDEKSVIVKILD